MNENYWLPCPVCNSYENELLMNLDCGNMDESRLYPTVRLNVCSICGHAYNDLSPAEIAGLGEYYNNEYAPANLNSVVTVGDLPGSRSKMTTERYGQLYKVLSPYINSCDAILDVGCAAGGFLDYLRERGFTRLYGADITRVYVEKAHRKNAYVIKHGSAESLPFNDGIFDVIIMEQVLEHLVNPAIAFREAGRVLKKEGVLCIGVPDAARYSDLYFYDYYWLLLREHVQHFDLNSLVQVAANEGFDLMASNQGSHAMMGETMVMPNLCTVFCNKGLSSGEIGNLFSKVIIQKLKKYIMTEASRLSDKRARLSELAESQRPVYVWGVGREFLYLYENAGLKECNLTGLIDANPFKQSSGKVNNMQILSPEMLSCASHDSVLLITAIAHEESILSGLMNLNYPGETVCLTQWHALGKEIE